MRKTPEKNLTQETCPDRASNPGPLCDRRACHLLFHNGGPGTVLFHCEFRAQCIFGSTTRADSFPVVFSSINVSCNNYFETVDSEIIEELGCKTYEATKLEMLEDRTIQS